MKCEFLTGSYAARDEAGVCRVAFDPQTGFSVEQAGSGYVNPSFVLVHPNGRVFYTVEETERGSVRAQALDGDLNARPGGLSTGGASPCHLALSGDLRRLYAANYSSGSLAAFELDGDGDIVSRTDLICHTGSGPNPERQEAAHVHFSMALDGLVYVCDLGMDAVFVYRDDGGRLNEVGRVAMPAGSGPRHLAHTPKHPDRLYCVAELGGRVYALKRGAGGYAPDQDVGILPADHDGPNTAAAIHITEDGELLLASNRGHDSVAVIPLGPDGRLGTPVMSGCVAEPRDFMICDGHVVVASQRDSVLRAYRLNRRTLRLEDTGLALDIGRPVCLCPLKPQ